MSSKLKLKNNLGNTFTLEHTNDTGDVVLTSKEILANTLTVDTMAELVALDTSKYDKVWLLGYYTKGDKEPVLYHYDATLTEENGGTKVLSSVGSGGWYFEPSGSVNVKDFGAKGDGATDDTLAIQNVINEDYSVYLPKGTYLLSNTIYSDRTGFKLFGEGEGVTKLKAISSFSGDYMLELGNGATSRYFNEIRNLSFFGNSVSDIVGVYLNKVNNQSKIIHCHFEDFNGGTISAAIKAENLALANVCAFNKFGTSLNTRDIWLVGAAGNSWLIEGNYFASGGRVYLDDSMTNVKIVNNSFDGGSQVYSDGASGARGIHITGNRFEGTAIPVNLGLIRGCYISDNFFQGNGSSTRAIDLLSSSSVQYATIANNFFENYVTNYVRSVLPANRLELYGNHSNDSYTTTLDYDTNATKTKFEGAIEVDSITVGTDILELNSSGIALSNKVADIGLEKALTGGGTTDDIFSITTSGTKGSYTIVVDVHIDFTPTSTAVSAGFVRYSWSHINDSGGASTDGAITTDRALSVISDAPTSRDIDSVSASLLKVSDSESRFRLTVGTTGSVVDLSAHCVVRIIYDNYPSRPAIAVV